MLTILTHEFLFIRKKEIWFYDGGDTEPAAYTSFCYALKRPAMHIDTEVKEFTTVLDLRADETKLFDAISSTFRYHIRKAATAGVECIYDVEPSLSECREIIRRFNVFAAKKKITPANSKRILALQEQKKVIISKAMQGDATLVTHVYLHDDNRILLMHTFHEEEETDPQLRGYANKSLHWEDIRLFREKGFHTYDFGGINSEELPGISHFKLSFGGKAEQADSFIAVKPVYRAFYKLYKNIR
jgi:lipid II:glycine glycyltransferase (peptidoglycan interpeptide bridge formation enzyme)